MKSLYRLSALVMLMAAPALAVPLPPAAADAPVIDGDVSDAIWSEALAVDRFYDVSPGDNVEPPVRTEAWITYDSRSVYVAFRAHDPSPKSIRAPYVSRDRVLGDQDFVQIDIDAQNDGKSSTLFRVNPRGIQTDGVFTEAAGFDDFAPDFAFDSAARVTATGWEAEMRIPLSSLRYARAEPQTWRVTLVRLYPREHRYMIRSTPIPRGSSCWLCDAMRVEEIRGLPSSAGVTVAPHVSARAIESGGGARTDFGADLKWQPSAGVAFDATIRPDFSQIESDVVQLAVNSRFAIFYPEKRPFFMEGSDLLKSPIQAIHTRTITSPLWGARLTGRPGNHAYTLVVADDRGGGSVIVPGPAFSSLATQPSDTLAVLGRYRYGHGRSSGGLLLTSRTSRGGDYANHVAGPDVLWWFSPKDRLTAQWLASRTTADGATRDGHAAILSWDRTARGHSLNVTLRDFDGNFRADSGFVPQSGIRSAFARASLLRYPKSKWFSRVFPDVIGERIEERSGALVSSVVYPRVYLEGWRASVAFVEYRENEKVRARDGSIHEQDYAFGMMRFLVSRRLPYLRVSARHGDELDTASARVGRGTALTLTATILPVDRLQIEITGEDHRLSLDGDRLFDARMLRAFATWTFSQRAFIRGIAERRQIDWNEDLAPGRISSRGPVTGSLLFGYRLNWQTSLYAGFVEGPQQEVFIKLSYAIHPTAALFRKEHS